MYTFTCSYWFSGDSATTLGYEVQVATNDIDAAGIAARRQLRQEHPEKARERLAIDVDGVQHPNGEFERL